MSAARSLLRRTTAAIDAASNANATAASRVSELGATKRNAAVRLEEIERALHAALASGNADEVTSLRAERQALEADLRDLDGASKIAQARSEAADRELAALEVEILNEQLANDSAAFRAAVARAWQLAASIRQTRALAKQRYHAARRGGHESADPERSIQIDPASAKVFAFLADFSSAPGGEAA
jgi:hypothetical protein